MTQWYEALFANFGRSYDKQPFTQGTVGEVDFVERELGGESWTSAAAPAATPSSLPGEATR
jgi:hypothetical protein